MTNDQHEPSVSQSTNQRSSKQDSDTDKCSTLSPAKTHTRTSKSPASGTYRSIDGGFSSCRFPGLELSPDDVSFKEELGRGNGGVVWKTQHKPTGRLMVRKTFELDVKTTVRSQIVRDFQILGEIFSPFIVEFYGLYYADKLTSINVEYMDAGGLDSLLLIVGRFPQPIIIQIAESVVQGLLFLWNELHIAHRNLKPSNIMLSRLGAVKLCDFVVSPLLAEVLASAFVCMRTYMAPERLCGEPFRSACDVWSLGLTLTELAIGRYPIPSVDPVDFVQSFAPDLDTNMMEHWAAARTGERLAPVAAQTENLAVFDSYAYIVEKPAPRLPAYCFSADFIHFVHSCLQKDPLDRLTIDLINTHILPSLSAASNQYASKQSTLCPPVHTSRDGDDEDDDDLRRPAKAINLQLYLTELFSRQQNEALDAVVLATEVDLDSLLTSESIVLTPTWDLPSTSKRRSCDSLQYLSNPEL